MSRRLREICQGLGGYRNKVNAPGFETLQMLDGRIEQLVVDIRHESMVVAGILRARQFGFLTSICVSAGWHQSELLRASSDVRPDCA